MDSNLKIILSEFNNLKGQFVITDMWDVERLVAIGDDGEDWYYITYNGRELKWQSCVGRVMPLKGYLRDKDYNYLIHIAKLNHYDQVLNENDFSNYLTEYLKKYNDNDKFITDFCWDLN